MRIDEASIAGEGARPTRTSLAELATADRTSEPTTRQAKALQFTSDQQSNGLLSRIKASGRDLAFELLSHHCDADFTVSSEARFDGQALWAPWAGCWLLMGRTACLCSDRTSTR
jgi:hypothetical protein